MKKHLDKQTNNLHVIKERNSKENILHLFESSKIENDWSFSNYKPSETSKWTHGYHRYPAKFIPQLVEKLFDTFIKSNHVHINDPFFGSGTTIVSAISRGYQVSGTDINKISHLISKVKATPIEPNYLNKKLDKFLLNLKNLKENQMTLFEDSVKSFVPIKNIDKINYWFKKNNKNKLGKILGLIYEEKDEIIRDFYLVAFSHILKNCSIWLQKSTKPTRDLNKKIIDPYIIYSRHLKKMERGNREFYKIIPESVKKNTKNFLNITIGDAKNQPVEQESVDLIVTSSPYVTSYEYSDLHQLSTIWLDLVEDLKNYRSEFIGTSNKKREEKDLRSDIALEIINQLEKKDISLSKSVNSFFHDMEEVFDESYRILKKNGRCCYVIGNTKLKGINILNAEVFAESLAESRFLIDRIIKREIPSKILPQKRDEKTGRFAKNEDANSQAYPIEYVVIGVKRE
ncbi:MAG: hypothetical protein EAX96_19745 [Candidatus Lokiarchaeota archaeon]|nr:hypothetical protein [Candidatus Lokiarchaeota archaeon]